MTTALYTVVSEGQLQ